MSVAAVTKLSERTSMKMRMLRSQEEAYEASFSQSRVTDDTLPGSCVDGREADVRHVCEQIDDNTAKRTLDTRSTKGR
jgi:hypothetical protein